MSSTLCMRKTPKEDDEICFKQPIKGIIARKYYNHDGSLGGGRITLTATDLPWLEGVLATGVGNDDKDRKDFERVIDILRNGDTVDMWFEV